MQNTKHYVARLLSGLLERPDQVVVWWRAQPIRAGDLARAVVTAASVLRGQGVGRGSTVALLLGNTPDMLIARYATNLVGATAIQPQTFNAVNALDRISVDVQAAMLTDANTALLIVDGQNLDRARALSAQMGSRPRLASMTPLSAPDGAEVVALSSNQGVEPFDLTAAVSA